MVQLCINSFRSTRPYSNGISLWWITYVVIESRSLKFSIIWLIINTTIQHWILAMRRWFDLRDRRRPTRNSTKISIWILSISKVNCAITILNRLHRVRFEPENQPTTRDTHFKCGSDHTNDGAASWCPARNRSFTVLTGLKVDTGTSTNTVFQ